MTNNDELALNGYEISNQLRHLADNEIDSDSFAVVTENYNGIEVEFERPITGLAIDAAEVIDALLAERDADKKRIAELEALTAEQDKRLIAYAAIATKNASEARSVSVKLPEPFTKSMYGTALYEHDDIVTMLAAAGIKLEVGE